MQIFDIAIIGGGPAGSTAGRLLAEWGHSVAILSRPQPRKPSLAESLPPSTRKLFSFLGIGGHLDESGCYRTSGNTVWWDRAQGRIEKFAGTKGYQVLRSDFDGLLLNLAEAGGAQVVRRATVRQVDFSRDGLVRLECDSARGDRLKVTARFVLDCSGRAGVLARKELRRIEPGWRTLAIAGVWQKESWALEDASHTLVETYLDGWAWSVPISSQVRYFTVMVDFHQRDNPAANRLDRIYHAQLQKTTHFNKILSGATLRAYPWSCDASLYSAHRFAGPQFLLVGDAASFIDPLSSYGVKKALASSWVGAVVANTCLRKPEIQKAALDFFSEREQQVYASYLRQSLRYFQEAAARHPHPFWSERANAHMDEGVREASEQQLKQDAQVLAAFEELKQSRFIHLQLAPNARIGTKPGIAGREVVLEKTLAGPGMPAGLRFFAGVDLPRLLEIAPAHSQVPDLYEAYNRVSTPVELPCFLGALSVMLAKGIMINNGQ